RRTPDAVRSRVSGAFDSVVHVGLAVSYAIGGGAVAWLGPRGVYVVAGVIAAGGALLALPALVESRRERGPVALEPIESTRHPDPSAYVVD
ncbi:MAG TPA: hypothetical protein VKA30_01915, partial [Actinomycetota bacterium]|nr:hypothetical protein [Actinomycetota bacterium]